jgi:hypothetical protein
VGQVKGRRHFRAADEIVGFLASDIT